MRPCETNDGGFKDRVPPGEGGHHHVGDDGRDDGGNQGLRLEIRVGVEHLDRKQGGAEGRPEHAADAGRHPRDHQHPAIVIAEPEDVGEIGTESGAHLGHRSLASRRASGSDRQHRCDELDRYHPPADDGATAMVGVDHRIGAVSLGFGGEGVDDPAHQQPGQGQHDQQHPRPLRHAPVASAGLAVTREVKTDDVAEQHRADPVDAPGQDRAAETRHHTHQHGEHHPTTEIEEIDPARETGGSREPRLDDGGHGAPDRGLSALVVGGSVASANVI